MCGNWFSVIIFGLSCGQMGITQTFRKLYFKNLLPIYLENFQIKLLLLMWNLQVVCLRLFSTLWQILFSQILKESHSGQVFRTKKGRKYVDIFYVTREYFECNRKTSDYIHRNICICICTFSPISRVVGCF